MPRSALLEDLQSSQAIHAIAIQEVGISQVRMPITFCHVDGRREASIASFDLSVDLAADVRGAHLSRFIEALQSQARDIRLSDVSTLAEEIRRGQNANSARINLEFPIFIERQTPASGQVSLNEYQVGLRASLSAGICRSYASVRVPVATCCPCSKEISEYGAHNQRSLVRVEVEFEQAFDVRELIDFVEASGSAPVFALVKRSDEKILTEQAYDNPKFVEDLVREIADKLSHFPAFEITCESLESIHPHNAYARIVQARAQ